MKITEFRSKYADGKLKEKLDDVSSAIMLYALYQDYVRVSHQESREYRLIDADVIIRDLGLFVKKYKAMIKQTDDMIEMSALMLGLVEVEKYRQKKQNKRKGGFKTKETKDRKLKEMLESGTDFFELPIHGFSVNFMYNQVGGKKIRSNAYNNWIGKFSECAEHLIPDAVDLLFRWNVDIHLSWLRTLVRWWR